MTSSAGEAAFDVGDGLSSASLQSGAQYLWRYDDGDNDDGCKCRPRHIQNAAGDVGDDVLAIG
jgi:hypothetical protein